MNVTHFLRRATCILTTLVVASCTHTPKTAKLDTRTMIVISVGDQRAVLLDGEKQIGSYPVSTALHGVGEMTDTNTTPRGRHLIAEKIGDGAPVGMVFVDRMPTGEIVEVNTPGRWPVITRILQLGGIEERNKNTLERLIYIHGTPVEHLLGKPASGGCIRMRSVDVIELFNRARVGTVVHIFEEPIEQAVRLARF